MESAHSVSCCSVYFWDTCVEELEDLADTRVEILEWHQQHPGDCSNPEPEQNICITSDIICINSDIIDCYHLCTQN